ncbi:hypothetical protein LV457_14455 [Mycobacterium sp. MYCO198283]|uniref:hypothetical protein n=1 Tax=Mycobacterium sp. MYCO198283 TaxID=2883505 RepID=UPI001E2EA5D9|nr:hypothetical protein [Mycobacterium sp. MYCO198283]MCG5433480.1 hypothetical protein [Mycobacterium sp. MYCO198283]
MSDDLEAKLAAVAADAAAGEDDQTDRPLPEHVTVSRPNRARSKVLQVRLNPEELEALERVAERRGLPVSTVAREQLLRLVAEERVPSAADDLTGLVTTLTSVAALIQEAVEARNRAEMRSHITQK